MKMQYIFIKKARSSISINNSNKLFQDMFKSVFDNVTFDTFQTTINNKSETIFFQSSRGKHGILYLTLSVKNKPSISAKILSYANNYLLCGIHRKDFHIITSYDESSEYYCNKLYPLFGKFERLMRAFIYITLTKSLGIKWYGNSFTKELKDAIKNKGNISDTNLIEHGLSEMTFSQLYDYLFQEFSYCSAEAAVYEQLLTRDLNAVDKNEIISILNSCKKESLWKRFFNDADFDLEEPLRKMRDYRNKVAHNKFMEHSEFLECKKNLIKINSTLQHAIEQLNSDIYTEKHLSDTILSFVALFAGLLKNDDAFSAAQKNFSSLGKTLIKAFKPYASISKMTAMYNMGTVISDIQKVSSALKSNITPPKKLLNPNVFIKNTTDSDIINEEDDSKNSNDES